MCRHILPGTIVVPAVSGISMICDKLRAEVNIRRQSIETTPLLCIALVKIKTERQERLPSVFESLAHGALD